jgi:hypothetical protein
MALSLKAFLGFDGSGFELGMKRAESTVNKFAKSVDGLAKDKIAELFGLVAMEEAGRRAIEYGHRIANVAKQMGVTTDEAQQLDYQMEQTGGSVESAATAFKKLAIAQAEVVAGNQDIASAFKTFGIDPAEAATMSRVDLYKKIGGIIGGQGEGELPPQMVDALQKLMGRGADSLVPSFKSGMRQLPQEMIIPNETVEQMHSYGTAMSESKSKVRKWFSELVTIPYEMFRATGGGPQNLKSARSVEAMSFLGKRFDRHYGVNDADKIEEDLKNKLALKLPFQGPPRRPGDTSGTVGSDPRQTPAQQSMQAIRDAAKILSNRGRPQIFQDLEEIEGMRKRADDLARERDNPNAQADAARLRFDAYNRVRGLLNPVPDKLNLNSLQSSGLESIHNPTVNLTGQTRRLAIVMEQLVAQLRQGGVIVPHAYSDTNYR